MKKKGLALVLALTLLVVGVVAGTLAWLTAKSDTVTNTFTTSDITVKLEETKGTPVTSGKEFKMIPGYTISKDPTATVLDGSEECYLFVKLDESTNFKNYMTYEMDEGWTVVPGKTNVYFRKVLTANIGKPYSVLKGDQVTVKGTVTKEMMETAEQDKPTLKITAYASQLYKNATTEFPVAEAWANVNPTTP